MMSHQQRLELPAANLALYTGSTSNCTDARILAALHLLLSSQASHCAAFAGNALIRVGVSPAYSVCLPPACPAVFKHMNKPDTPEHLPLCKLLLQQFMLLVIILCLTLLIHHLQVAQDALVIYGTLQGSDT